MCYFINFTLKQLHFQSRNVRFGSYLWRWRRNVSRKMTPKPTSKRQMDVLTSCTRDVLLPPCKSQFLASVNNTDNPVGYARTYFLKSFSFLLQYFLLLKTFYFQILNGAKDTCMKNMLFRHTDYPRKKNIFAIWIRQLRTEMRIFKFQRWKKKTA